MVGAFSVCLLPSGISILIVIASLKLDRSAAISSIVILTSNSLWNVFIYSAREKKFRAALKTLYKKLYEETVLDRCASFIWFGERVFNKSHYICLQFNADLLHNNDRDVIHKAPQVFSSAEFYSCLKFFNLIQVFFFIIEHTSLA